MKHTWDLMVDDGHLNLNLPFSDSNRVVVVVHQGAPLSLLADTARDLGVT